MANNDCVLGSDSSSGRGSLDDGDQLVLSELMELAHDLQSRAMEAKLADDHKTAVKLYRELLPCVRALDAAGIFIELVGKQCTPIVERALELEEIASAA